MRLWGALVLVLMAVGTVAVDPRFEEGATAQASPPTASVPAMPTPSPRPSGSPLPTAPPSLVPPAPPAPTAPPFTVRSPAPSPGPDLSQPYSGSVKLPPFGRVTFRDALTSPVGPSGQPAPSPRGLRLVAVESFSDQFADVALTADGVRIMVPAGFAIQVDPPGRCQLVDRQPNTVSCPAVGRYRFGTIVQASTEPPCPPSCEIPGSATIAPAGTAYFYPPPIRPPSGVPQPRTPILNVTSYSDRSAMLTHDGRTLTIAGLPDSSVQVLHREGPPCTTVGGQANVMACLAPPPGFVYFTTAGSRFGEAMLVRNDPRPCVPEAGQRACDTTRTALWNGEAAAWTARGVVDGDARFNETVVFRVRAGDPQAISAIARILGAPYLQITRLRFAGVAAGQGDEYIEISNMGGGAQDMTGWTIRAPGRGVVFRFPDGFVMDPAGGTGVCRVYTGAAAPDYFCAFSIGSADVWPDEAGEAVLFYDALALAGDAKMYARDPDRQPPPPHLQSVITVAAGF